MCHFKGKNIDDKNFNNFNDILSFLKMIRDGNITLEQAKKKKKKKKKNKNGHKSDLNKIKRIRNKSIQQKSALYNIETL